MEFLIVRNNKAPVKSVFEYLAISEIRNPNTKQQLMLNTLCDKVEFHQTDGMWGTELKETLNTNDYMYSCPYGREFPVLVAVGSNDGIVVCEHLTHKE